MLYYFKTSLKWLLIIGIMLFLVGCSKNNKNVIDFEQVSKDDKIVIKFSHVVAEDSPKGQAARRFAQLVGERTNGKVEVQVYPNSLLYKDGEEFEALRENRIQMIAPATAKLSQEFPQWQIFDLPFLFKDYDHVHSVMDGPVGKELKGLLKDHNMKAVAMWDNGFKEMSANTPLVKISDFENKKFRVMGSDVLVSQFELLKASSVVKPFNELYQALESEEVGGAENPPANFYTKKFYQVQKFLTLSDHGYLGYVLIVNDQFWQEIPSETRQILEDTLIEVTAWEREHALMDNLNALQAIKATGDVQIYHLSDEEKEEWKVVLKPLYTQYEGVIGRDLIEKALEKR